MSTGREMIRALLKGANDGAPASRRIADLTRADRVGQARVLTEDQVWDKPITQNRNFSGSSLDPLEVDPLIAMPWEMSNPINIGNRAGPPPGARGLAAHAQFSTLPWKGGVPPPNAPQLENDLLDLLLNNDQPQLNAFANEYFGGPWKLVQKDVLDAIENISSPMR